jgi:hypothetical protein
VVDQQGDQQRGPAVGHVHRPGDLFLEGSGLEAAMRPCRRRRPEAGTSQQTVGGAVSRYGLPPSQKIFVFAATDTPAVPVEQMNELSV